MMRNGALQSEQMWQNKAVAAYQGGLTLEQAVEPFGVTPQALYAHMRSRGIPRRTSAVAHRLPINDTAFDELNELSEYWAGFLLADGHVATTPGTIATPQVELAIGEVDRAHLESFKEFLKSSHPITTRPAGGYGGRPTVKISFRSPRISERLLQLWSGQRKKLARVPIAQLAGSRHFWRGVVDGDGSLYIAEGGHVARLSLCGSRDTIELFSGFLRANGIVRGGKPKPCKSICQINYGGRTAQDVARLLYEACSVALPRKLETARRVLLLNPRSRRS